MLDDFKLDVPPEQRRILQTAALAGLIGGTPEEVAAYLLTRGLDDLLRSGVIRLVSEPSDA